MSDQVPDDRLVNRCFPRSNAYNPGWVIKNGMGSNVLWLTEWLSSAVALQPGMRILDLGCGRGTSSIFLAREFGVQVWATDLWISASENARRIADAGVSDSVFPIHADARGLPFAAEFFDAILSIDSFSYYGTDDLFLNYLTGFVKPEGQIGIAGAGVAQDIEQIPDHLSEMWMEDFWCLHSAAWWRNHWGRTGLVDVESSEMMVDGWKSWLSWLQTAYPGNAREITAIQADAGRNFGYVRTVARRRRDAGIVDYCSTDTLRSLPMDYEHRPLLRASD